MAWDYSWKNRDFPRNWCILDFKEWIEKYNIKPDILGFTSSVDPELEFIDCKEKVLVEYPKYDLHTIGNYYDSFFDFFYLIKHWNIYIIHFLQ
jgi:hypothetical protein